MVPDIKYLLANNSDNLKKNSFIEPKISVPQFSQPCGSHDFRVVYTNKNNPYYECKNCLEIRFRQNFGDR
jgi:hypothetical protein